MHDVQGPGGAGRGDAGDDDEDDWEEADSDASDTEGGASAKVGHPAHCQGRHVMVIIRAARGHYLCLVGVRGHCLTDELLATGHKAGAGGSRGSGGGRGS